MANHTSADAVARRLETVFDQIAQEQFVGFQSADQIGAAFGVAPKAAVRAIAAQAVNVAPNMLQIGGQPPTNPLALPPADQGTFRRVLR